MGTHLIPREISGEGRILYIFTQKGLIYTVVGIFIGGIIQTILSALGAGILGWIILFLTAGAGFIIGQVKVPTSNAFDILKKTGGDSIDELIVRYFKFKKNRKIYTYDKGGKSK